MGNRVLEGPSGTARLWNAAIVATVVLAVFIVGGLVMGRVRSLQGDIAAPMQSLTIPVPSGSILLAADTVPLDPRLPGIDIRRVYLVPCSPAQLKGLLDAGLDHPELKRDYGWNGSLSIEQEPARGVWRGGYVSSFPLGETPSATDHGTEVDVVYATGVRPRYQRVLRYLDAVAPELSQNGALVDGAIKPGWGVMLVRVVGDAVSDVTFDDGGQSAAGRRVIPYDY